MTVGKTVSITVTPTNDAPVDGNETVSVTEDVTLSVNAASGLLANATDIDGGALTISGFSIAGEAGPFTVGSAYTITGVGRILIAADGAYAFIPAANYTGAIPVITYTVSDGAGGTDTSTLTLSMSTVNDAPVALDDAITTPEDTAFVGTLPVATDVDGDALTYAAGTITPSHGSVTVNADGTYTYTPSADYNGPDSFSYTVTDGTVTVEKTVTITVTPVKDAPVAVDDMFTVDEDGSTTIAVLGNDGDADGDALTVTEVDGQAIAAGETVAVANGTVTLTAGELVFAPIAGYHGAASFTYTITDGTNTATATVSGTVTPVHDGPVANPDAASSRDGQSTAIDVLGNDSDPDGDPLTVVEATSPNGSVTINPDGTLTFIPKPGFVGTAIVTYRISDGNGGFASADVEIACTESPHVSYPTQEEKPVATQLPLVTPVHVDGMVIDAVQGIGDLNSIAMRIGEHGIVLDTVNRISSLGGVGANGSGQETARPLDPARISSLQQALDGSGFTRGSTTWDPRGLTGFSLRFGLLGNSASSRITIESLVRERTLIVNITEAFTDPLRKVVEYRILQDNGAPLPGWLEQLNNNVLIGERPANVDQVKLRITILFSDGSSESKSVAVETISGEIKPLEEKRSERVLPFFEQFGSKRQFSDDDIEGLGSLLMEKAG